MSIRCITLCMHLRCPAPQDYGINAVNLLLRSRRERKFYERPPYSIAVVMKIWVFFLFFFVRRCENRVRTRFSTFWTPDFGVFGGCFLGYRPLWGPLLGGFCLTFGLRVLPQGSKIDSEALETQKNKLFSQFDVSDTACSEKGV